MLLSARVTTVELRLACEIPDFKTVSQRNAVDPNGSFVGIVREEVFWFLSERPPVFGMQ